MDSFQKFYDRALRFLSFRPRSEKEIRDFLKRPRKKRSKRKTETIDEATVEKIIAKLKEFNFINDEEFAKWWVEQRQGHKPRGKRVIEMELKQKGIPEELITNYQLLITNQLDLAKKAVEKKAVMYRGLPREKAYQKLSQFLLRRGFDWETVREVVDEVLKKEYNKSS